MKGWSIIEVITVYILSFMVARYLVAIFSDFILLEQSILGFNYILPTIFYFFPIFIILVAKRSFNSYGYTKKNWDFDIDVGMSLFLFATIPFLFGFMIISTIGVGLLDPSGALIISALAILALILILKVLKGRDSQEKIERSKTRNNLIVMVILLLVPMFLGLIFNNFSSSLVSLVIWQFFISGFGEEFKYRGYYQSTINIEYGHPYKLAGIEFGPGLIIASMLFSLSHILNPFNPFLGTYEIALWWGTFTFVTGFTFGLIREKTQSILAAGIYHGLPDAVGEGIAKVFGWL